MRNGLVGDRADKRALQWVQAVALLCLLGSVLFPQGVGIETAYGLPKLDLPRISMLALFALALVYLTLYHECVDWRVAPRTTIVLASISVWQLISAVIADAGTWSLIWAVSNIITYWGFALLFLLLAGRSELQPMVSRLLTTTAILLAGWACLEFITQEKLFPYRNLYAADPNSLFSISLRRRVMVDGVESDPLPLMSLGPYFSNLILGSVLCALVGFLLVGSERRPPVWFALGTGLAMFSVLSAQSRTAFLALLVMLGVALYLQRSRWARVAMTIGGGLGFVLFIGIYGAQEFVLAFGHATVSYGTQEVPSGSVSAQEVPSGSVQGRLIGLSWLLGQLVTTHAYLFGVGPGALFDGGRVKTTLTIFSDQGSFFAFMAESGIVIGLLLAYLLGTSMVQGLRSSVPSVRAAALGLGGFWLTALVSITPHGWTVALVLAGLVESWDRRSKTGAGNRATEVKG